MAAKRFEEQLEAVRAALGDRASTTARASLTKTLRGSNGHLVGVVADALDEGDAELLTLLPAAFARMLEDPVKRDPGCRAKTAIAKALDRVEVRAEAVFLAGVRHVQLEPVWGGRVDTAAELRGVCGMALVHARHERAMIEVAELLADRETRARIAGARALAASGDRIVGEPLLRLRVAAGERDPDVVGECFAALFELAGADALDWVAKFLRTDDEALADAAALALGGSRLPAALPILRNDLETIAGGTSRRVRLVAIALLREPAAWQFLLDVVEQESIAKACDAIEALAAFRHDRELADRLRAAVQRRGDAKLSAALAEALVDPA